VSGVGSVRVRCGFVVWFVQCKSVRVSQVGRTSSGKRYKHWICSSSPKRPKATKSAASCRSGGCSCGFLVHAVEQASGCWRITKSVVAHSCCNPKGPRVGQHLLGIVPELGILAASGKSIKQTAADIESVMVGEVSRHAVSRRSVKQRQQASESAVDYRYESVFVFAWSHGY